MSRLSTKQRRARRRRREGYQAWMGWRLMQSGVIGARIREFTEFMAYVFPAGLDAGRSGRTR